MNENSDIIFVPDDSASHEWTERDSELVEEYAGTSRIGIMRFPARLYSGTNPSKRR